MFNDGSIEFYYNKIEKEASNRLSLLNCKFEKKHDGISKKKNHSIYIRLELDPLVVLESRSNYRGYYIPCVDEDDCDDLIRYFEISSVSLLSLCKIF